MKLPNDIPQENLRKLASNMILQAIRDLTGKDIAKKLDALLWLGGEDIGFWLEWADMPFADPFQMLVSGQARKVKTSGRYKAA